MSVINKYSEMISATWFSMSAERAYGWREGERVGGVGWRERWGEEGRQEIDR